MSGTEMNTELETNSELETKILKLVACGEQVENVSPQQLYEVAENHSLEECAQWLLEYKESKNLLVRVQQPEWVSQFMNNLIGLGEQIWPLMESEIHAAVASKLKANDQELELTKSTLTDANLKLVENAKVIEGLEQKLAISEQANTQIQSLIQNLKTAQETAISALQEKNQVNESRVQALELDLETSEQKLSESQEQLNNTRLEVNTLISERDAVDLKVKQLEEQVEQLTTKKSESDIELAECNNSIKDLKAEVVSLKKNRNPEEKKLERLQTKNESQKIEIKDLNVRLVQSEGTIEQLVTQNTRQGEQLQRSSDRLILASEAYEKAIEAAGELRGKLSVYELQGES